MISREDVYKISELARIKIIEPEKESFQKDLSLILGYVETLNEVDTMMAEPTLNATLSLNVVREDEIVERNLKEEEGVVADIIKLSPDHDDGFIKVKAIL